MTKLLVNKNVNEVLLKTMKNFEPIILFKSESSFLNNIINTNIQKNIDDIKPS